MVKDVFITIISIKYSGKSIGDDIRIEWEILGKSGGFNKKIKSGTIKQLNEVIGVFPVDQSSFTLPITLRVIERDLILNDAGQQNVKIKLDLSSSRVQKSTHKIKVLESRWEFKRPEAIFDIKLELRVTDSIRFVKEQEKGWLTIRMDNGTRQSLPALLKVRFEELKDKREYFTVLEGAHRGKGASVKLDKSGDSFLTTVNHHTGLIEMTYSVSRKELTVNGKRYKTMDYPNSPWNKGLYDVEIPDAPHRGGISYSNVARKATVWFRVGHTGDRYIHTGSASLGCITLIEHKKWDSLYTTLIRSRKGDSISIGILEVID